MKVEFEEYYDIEVGEYVRTFNGKIFKCTSIYFDKIISNHAVYKAKHIVKHSKNIIDLIEKYDFVNERLVIDIDRKNNKICLLEPFDDKNLSNSFIVWHDIEDIKSILTKEQFESMKYEVR